MAIIYRSSEWDTTSIRGYRKFLAHNTLAVISDAGKTPFTSAFKRSFDVRAIRIYVAIILTVCALVDVYNKISLLSEA